MDHRRESARARNETAAGSDAILVGINTILADDPSLTVRSGNKNPPLRRIILDSLARTPLTRKL
jgi:diaminohydroxyphosphoribosylaminopyrimidine deaminase/5-amino-6-(5-phosphoribosylamino)uracil reductase